MTALEIIGEDRASRWLVTCDHATNHVPAFVNGGDLGIDRADMDRHIAYDVGAAGLAVALAERLDAPAVLAGFSRLVIDPNRGEDDPTLVRMIYDGTIIPANRHADAAEVARRIDLLYRPYHAAVRRIAERRTDTVIVAVHSFTPCLRGDTPRPWHLGVCHSHRDARLSRALIARMSGDPALVVGDNEPYSGHLPGDSIHQHALERGLHNTLLEVRNDLLGTPIEQRNWADRLAAGLSAALIDVGG